MREASKTGKGPDIVIFGDLQSRGGGARVFACNIKKWVANGYQVEVLGYRNAEPFLADELPLCVSFRHLNSSHKITTLKVLWRYARQLKPRVILGTSHLSNLILAWLTRLPGHETHCWLTVHQDFAYSQRQDAISKRRRLRAIRSQYSHAAGIICVSRGAADSLMRAAGLPADKVHVVYNAVLDDSILMRAEEKVDHQWFPATEVPVIISVGRLAPQKDYATLLQAFALVRSRRPCRLIILGEGPLRQELEDQARKLGITTDISLPGFIDNPYSWMRNSQVFALSSRWEGFGNVVAEALGLGLPIVATDCPSGPAEILGHGRYGRLVPPGDVQGMAAALLETLERGPLDYDPVEAARPYRAEETAPQYLRLFGLS
jgi:glycosyltransferase involved in cell wall biosynthesis